MKRRFCEQALMLLCATFVTVSTALADTSAVVVLPGSVTVTGPAATTIKFPVERVGDTGYDAWLSYETADDSAQAGFDYRAATGALRLPAAQTALSIPVSVIGSRFPLPDKAFKLKLTGIVGTGPEPAFSAHADFATEISPESVTVADLNGDGRLESITANAGSDTVSVLANQTAPGAGTPAFAAQRSFATGDSPAAVVHADVNGDGKPDLIAANSGSDNVSVLLNVTDVSTGVPSFAAQQTFSVNGSGPSAIAAADMNGDGLPDLIVTNADSGTIAVLLNTTSIASGTLAFASARTFAAGIAPVAVAAADINGDGLPDVVAANGSSNTLSVLLNAADIGAGTFELATRKTFVTGAAPRAVAAADVNGDGKVDVIVANAGSDDVSVLLNTTAPGAPAPAFDAGRSFSAGNGPRSVTAADLNGDGRADLLVADSNGNKVSALLNVTAPGAATPAFAPGRVFATGGMPCSTAAADINGDGKADAVAANADSGSVSVLLNTAVLGSAAVEFGPQQIFPSVGGQPWAATTADVNGDGRHDLIAANSFNANIGIRLNLTPPGAATAAFAVPVTFSAIGAGTIAVVAADINSDGRPDVIAGNQPTHNVAVLFNTTTPGAMTPSFAPGQLFAVGHPLQSMAAADINGDGKPDLLILANEFSGGNKLRVMLNTTAPGSATANFAAAQTFTVGTGPISVTAADVNGDGKADLVSANLDGDSVSVLLNTTPPGAAVPSFAAQQPFTVAGGASAVVATDVNGDGKVDLASAVLSEDRVSVMLNTTAPGAMTASFTAEQTFTAGDFCAFLTAADLNGDGRPDLIVANLNSDDLSVLLNTTAPGAATPDFAPPQTFVTGDGTRFVATADIDGNGVPDLVTANKNDSTFSMLLNRPYDISFTPASVTGTIHYSVPFAEGLPSALDFGNQPVGGAGVSQTLVLSNTGNADLNIAGIMMDGVADFTETDNCAASLPAAAAGNRCIITVTFTPAGTGRRIATLTLTSNGPDSPQAVVLAGTGVAAASPPPVSGPQPGDDGGSGDGNRIGLAGESNGGGGCFGLMSGFLLLGALARKRSHGALSKAS